MGTDYVRVAGCHCMQDSISGAAYKVRLANDEEKWIPYSVTEKREVNKLKTRQDVIVIKKWFAVKEGISYA